MANEKDQAREYVKLTRMHEFKLAFTVVKRDLLEGSVKKDRETKLPLIDNDGNELRYPSKYKITGAYTGGEMSFYVTKEQFDFMKPNDLYLGIGRMIKAMDFGNEVLMPEFSTIEEL